MKLGWLLVRKGLRAAQTETGLMSVQNVSDRWTRWTALAGQRTGIRGRVGHGCCEL